MNKKKNSEGKIIAVYLELKIGDKVAKNGNLSRPYTIAGFSSTGTYARLERVHEAAESCSVLQLEVIG